MKNPHLAWRALTLSLIGLIGAIGCLAKRQFVESDTSVVLARIEQFRRVNEVFHDAAVHMELMIGTLPVPSYYFDHRGRFQHDAFSKRPSSLGNVHAPMVGIGIYSLSQGSRTGMNVVKVDPIYFTTDEFDLSVAGRVHMGIADELVGHPVDPTDPFDSTQRIWGFAVNRWGYVFSSVGPDGTRDIFNVSGPEDFLEKINLVYDPTNGILSTGDLISPWVFGEEAEQDE